MLCEKKQDNMGFSGPQIFGDRITLFVKKQCTHSCKISVASGNINYLMIENYEETFLAFAIIDLFKL